MDERDQEEGDNPNADEHEAMARALDKLAQALCLCHGDHRLTQDLLFDLLTTQEILELAVRWETAQALFQAREKHRQDGKRGRWKPPVNAIAKTVGTSTSTVTRVSRFAVGDAGRGGYLRVYRSLRKQSNS